MPSCWILTWQRERERNWGRHQSHHGVTTPILSSKLNYLPSPISKPSYCGLRLQHRNLAHHEYSSMWVSTLEDVLWSHLVLGCNLLTSVPTAHCPYSLICIWSPHQWSPLHFDSICGRGERQKDSVPVVKFILDPVQEDFLEGPGDIKKGNLQIPRS